MITKEHNLNIEYKLNKNIPVSEFIEILNNSTLGDRRPMEDLEIIQGMLDNADLIVIASIDDKIIGIARAVSAPAATEYYPKIGFTAHNSAWTIDKGELL